MPKRHRLAGFLCFVFLGLSHSAQAEEIAAPASAAPLPVADALLSAHQTAVECATAQLVERAGQQHKTISNIVPNIYKAGDCAGKMQTFMLIAQKENPACFPKMSLEEGIALFVKWADAHPHETQSDYITGFSAAFAEMVPCLKQPAAKN